MITRRAALISGAAALATPAFAQTPTLRALAADKGILFGTAAATYELKDADFAGRLRSEHDPDITISLAFAVTDGRPASKMPN